MSYLLVIFLVGLLILVHELGHLAAARIAGVPVARFSVGLGPAMWEVRWGRTAYRLSVIPLGGYVVLGVDSVQRLLEIPAWKRIAFFASGPLANLLLPVALLCGPEHRESRVFRRGSDAHSDQADLAHSRSDPGSGRESMGRPDAVVGGIGLVVEGSSFVGLDVVRAIQFAIFMSLNLAVLNLLPIPVLDGGKIVMVWLERCFPRTIAYNWPWLWPVGSSSPD